MSAKYGWSTSNLRHELDIPHESKLTLIRTWRKSYVSSRSCKRGKWLAESATSTTAAFSKSRNHYPLLPPTQSRGAEDRRQEESCCKLTILGGNISFCHLEIQEGPKGKQFTWVRTGNFRALKTNRNRKSKPSVAPSGARGSEQLDSRGTLPVRRGMQRDA